MVFFPSYSFLEQVNQIWTKNGTMQRFAAKKKADLSLLHYLVGLIRQCRSFKNLLLAQRSTTSYANTGGRVTLVLYLNRDVVYNPIAIVNGSW